MKEKKVYMCDKKLFGLVGKNIEYSFSRDYFSKKFKTLDLDNHSYQNFDLKSIDDLVAVFSKNSPFLKGLNVTIPYKERVGDFLDEIDPVAESIGAINTVKIETSGKKTGFNTDVYGFENSLKPLLKESHKNALILGTGGASKAVAHVFKKLDIDYKFVSRNPTNENQITYSSISSDLLSTTTVLVNCSPLGTSPATHLCPDLPYKALTANHLLYDLIYNPSETTFLRLGKEQGATIKNGLEMLVLQAERSWKIWNSVT